VFFVTKFLSGFDWTLFKSEIFALKERTTSDVKPAFRNDRNLKSFPIHSRLSGQVSKKQFCERKNCPICKDKSVFQSSSLNLKGQVINFKQKFGCKESSVVYFLFCEKCDLGYVGATSRELSRRFSEHVGNFQNTSVEIQTVHLNFKNPHLACKPKIGILEKCSDQDLLSIEKWYIKKLAPVFNEKDAVYVRVGSEYKLK
jgi:hypothetical protein